MYCGIIGNCFISCMVFSRYTENAIYYHLEYEWSYLYNAWHIFTCKSPDDYILAAFLQACTPLIAGIFSIVWLRKRYTGLFKWPTIGEIINSYKDVVMVATNKATEKAQIIILHNAYNSNLSLETKGSDDGSCKLEFASAYDKENLNKVPYEICTLKEV